MNIRGVNKWNNATNKVIFWLYHQKFNLCWFSNVRPGLFYADRNLIVWNLTVRRCCNFLALLGTRRLIVAIWPKYFLRPVTISVPWCLDRKWFTLTVTEVKNSVADLPFCVVNKCCCCSFILYIVITRSIQCNFSFLIYNTCLYPLLFFYY